MRSGKGREERVREVSFSFDGFLRTAKTTPLREIKAHQAFLSLFAGRIGIFLGGGALISVVIKLSFEKIGKFSSTRIISFHRKKKELRKVCRSKKIQPRVTLMTSFLDGEGGS